MVETVLAVSIITFAFLLLFKLSNMLTGKILLEHAAMRVARARAVGFNDFMCTKAARVSVIPVSGKRLWPAGDEFDVSRELGSVAVYMGTPDAGVARGVLEYERWEGLHVKAEAGDSAEVRFTDDWFKLSGSAGVENHDALYLNDQGR